MNYLTKCCHPDHINATLSLLPDLNFFADEGW